MTTHLSHDEKQKQIYKEAWKELLNEYVLKFGYFSIATIALLIIGALFYFVICNTPGLHPELSTVQQPK